MTERVIPPHKARLLLTITAIAALHIIALLLWWPQRWPTSYKWVLLPDGVSLYFLGALALQNLRPRNTEQDLNAKGATSRNG